jgi:hypothetical protein
LELGGVLHFFDTWGEIFRHPLFKCGGFKSPDAFGTA